MGGRFPSTRWSLVLAARGEAPSEALATLCEAYWYPLYAFARRYGSDRDGALDLTQGFFAELLEKGYLEDLRPGEGRFRSFLLSAFKHYIYKRRDRSRALKRGGAYTVLSLDVGDAEQRYRHEPPDDWTPERAYEHSWALTTLRNAEQRLAAELEAEGKSELYRQLGPAIFGRESSRPYRETARLMGMSEGAVKMAVVRLRRRFGRTLRSEVAQTVTSDDQIDDEIRSLLSVVRSL